MSVYLSVLGLSTAVAAASFVFSPGNEGPFGTGLSKVQSVITMNGGPHGTGGPVEVHRNVPGGSDRQCAAYGSSSPLYKRCRNGYQQMIAIEADGTQVLISEEPNPAGEAVARLD